ncbi:MAG: hypothetical protein IT265_02175, partial [Saprospiraceae bacterium]|nr:hypothetical protein [Saprospiraceae bacterium]
MENIQYKTFELGEQNILEEFYELIEKQRLDSSKDFQLGDFYNFLSDFDLSYQKFNVKREGDFAVKYVEMWLKH